MFPKGNKKTNTQIIWHWPCLTAGPSWSWSSYTIVLWSYTRARPGCHKDKHHRNLGNKKTGTSVYEASIMFLNWFHFPLSNAWEELLLRFSSLLSATASQSCRRLTIKINHCLTPLIKQKENFMLCTIWYLNWSNLCHNWTFSRITPVTPDNTAHILLIWHELTWGRRQRDLLRDAFSSECQYKCSFADVMLRPGLSYQLSHSLMLYT